MPHNTSGTSETPAGVAQRTLIRAVTVLAVVVVAVLVWKAATILLLAYLAILCAIFFQGVAERIAGWIHLPYWGALILVLVVVAGTAAASVYLRAPAVTQQVADMREELPKSLTRLKGTLEQHIWGRELLKVLPTPIVSPHEAPLPASPDVFSSAFETVGHLIFVAFTFLFVAFQPQLYRRGIEALLPKKYSNVRRLLPRIWSTLWWWLAARLAAMALVGVLITIGVSILDLPFALSLGILAAVLDFIPNFGPIIAAGPAIVLALVQSPEKALYVALLYWVVQILEGYLITPIVQRRAIDLAPALVIVSQFVLGAALGPLGFVTATPLLALVTVIVDELYLEPEAESS